MPAAASKKRSNKHADRIVINHSQALKMSKMEFHGSTSSKAIDGVVFCNCALGQLQALQTNRKTIHYNFTIHYPGLNFNTDKMSKELSEAIKAEDLRVNHDAFADNAFARLFIHMYAVQSGRNEKESNKNRRYELKNSAIFVCFAILRGNYHLHVNCRHLRAISPDGFSLRSGVCLASWNCMCS